jgi:AcrR family transcriptional regulator
VNLAVRLALLWVTTHNNGVARISKAAKAEHRQRLLAAAAAEFAEKGLDAARIDDISVAAGLAKGTIYNYFDSKVDVFRAVVEEWAQRTIEERDAVAVDGPIREQLLAVLRADVGVVAEMEEFARTAMREVLTAPSKAVHEILPAWEPVDREITLLMSRAQERGELRTDRSPEELMRVFLTVTNGLLLEHWVPGSDIALDDIPDLVIDYYLDGARSRPS